MKKLWKIQREQRLHMLLTRMIKKGSENGMYGKRPSDKCINKIKEGKAKIVIGARSAIFAPVTNLGIIIIDEEHDSSYKSEANPKYDANRSS